MNIEMQGVNYVKLAISKTDYLIPNIKENDREPSWDGDIEVYCKAGNVHAKADLILKVPVQVKGHQENDLSKKIISYPVEYVDMQKYLDIGGTVFFVVYVDEEGENSRIYYTEFLPYGLKKLLKRRKDRKSKNISMKLLPSKKDDISDVFLAFARNMKMQRAAISSEDVKLEDLIKEGIIPELSFGFSCVPKEDITPFDLMLKGNVYLYAKLLHGIQLPVEHIETIEMAATTIDLPVTVNGKLFYDSYSVVYKKDVIELHFGKSTKHIIDRSDNTKQKFNFTLSGNLSERIRDEEFIIEALTAEQFEVDSIVCPLNEATPEEIATFDLPNRREHLSWLKTVKDLLDALDVNIELDCSTLTDNDEKNIQLLKTAVLDGQKVPLKKGIENSFGFFSVGNIKILVNIFQIEDNEHYIYNYNDAPIELKTKGDNGQYYPSSYHVLLKKDTILKSNNLNYNKILEQIKLIPISVPYSSQVVVFLLELLSSYDESKQKSEDILEFAIKLAKWLLEVDSCTPRSLLLLNYYQAIKRKRTLKEEEIKELLQIIETNTEGEEIYTGVYLLLDNQEAAKIHFYNMNDEQQAVFRNYPIFHFWIETKEAQ